MAASPCSCTTTTPGRFLRPGYRSQPEPASPASNPRRRSCAKPRRKRAWSAFASFAVWETQSTTYGPTRARSTTGPSFTSRWQARSRKSGCTSSATAAVARRDFSFRLAADREGARARGWAWGNAREHRSQRLSRLRTQSATSAVSTAAEVSTSKLSPTPSGTMTRATSRMRVNVASSPGR